MFISSLVFVVCCVGSDLCDKLITHSEEPYCVCDLEISTMRWPRPDMGCCATKQKAATIKKNELQNYLSLWRTQGVCYGAAALTPNNKI